MKSKIHLLLVEDRISDAELLINKLRGSNVSFDYTLVDNEQEYLAELQKEPDIIISDFSLPSFGGMRALKLLRDQNSDTPFILVSGTIGEEIAVDAMVSGANDYIMKDKLNRLPVAIERELKDAEVKKQLQEADAVQKENAKRIESQYIQLKEYIEQNKQLKYADLMKSKFVSTMSHELRAPLNSIIGFSGVLKDGKAGPLSSDQQEYCTDIYNSGQFLLSLINDILDLSKIESGKIELSLEPVDLGQCLKESLKIVKEQAALHNINLKLEINESLGFSNYDPRKVKQILFNLLSNAVKFTPDNSTVTLSGVIENANTFIISVADMGEGMSEEDIQNLFKPFTQVHKSPEMREKGTGLGLLIAKHLVELHGGNISVESILGSGTTFIVKLPYKPSQTEKQQMIVEAYSKGNWF